MAFTSKGTASKRIKLTREYILERVTEEEIFRFYLGIEPTIGQLVCSPLREDKRPTVSFRETERGIYMKDFDGSFYGDCFEVVQHKFGVDFYEALKTVAGDFHIYGTPSKRSVLKREQLPKISKSKDKKRIEIKRRMWSEQDKEYWTTFGITKAILERYHVAPVDVLWIDAEIKYVHSERDPAYAYYFGDGNYKIYFPLRREYRFISNGSHLQGWNQLDLSANHIFITKSLKDVIVFTMLGYHAIAPHAEGALVKEETMKFFENYDITFFFDNDGPGITWAHNNSREYNRPFIYLDGDSKDVSDLVRDTSTDHARSIISNLLTQRKYVTENSSLQELKWPEQDLH